MNVTVEDTGKCRKVLRVELSPQEVAHEVDRMVNEYARHSQIPGFRRGKAPVAMVRARYQKDIEAAVKEDLIPKSYRKAIEQEKLEVVAVVDMQGGDIVPNQPMSLTITLDTRPEIALPEYKGIALTRKPVEVSDADVDEAMNSFRDRYAKFSDAPEGYVIAVGDLAQIDYSARVGDRPLVEVEPTAGTLGEGTDFWVRVDENAFIPEFAGALPGKRVGESLEVAVTFPGDFALESLRAAGATYAVTIKAIRLKELPALDDELARKIGAESLDAMRQNLRDGMLRRAESVERSRQRGEIHNFLLGAVQQDMPESLVQEETTRLIRDMLHQNMQRGATEEVLREHAEEIHQGAAKSALNNVKLRLILSRIAREEGVGVESAEMDAEIQALAQRVGQSPELVRKRLVENRALDDLRMDLLVRKTTDRLLELAAITE